MATVSTLVDSTDITTFRTTEGVVLYEYTLLVADEGTPIGPGDESTELSLSAFERGKVCGVMIGTTSDNFHLSLRISPGVTPPSIDEIYRVETINTVWVEYALNVFFYSPTSQLYCVISNDSGTDDIISVLLRLYIAPM